MRAKYTKTSPYTAPEGALKLNKNGLSNAQQGKLITVTDLTPAQRIEDSNGNAVTGLAVEPVADDEVNTPTRSGMVRLLLLG